MLLALVWSTDMSWFVCAAWCSVATMTVHVRVLVLLKQCVDNLVSAGLSHMHGIDRASGIGTTGA